MKLELFNPVQLVEQFELVAIEKYVKSLIPTISQSSQSVPQERELIRPSQIEPGVRYRDPRLRLNDQEIMRTSMALDKLSDSAKPSPFVKTLLSFMENVSNYITKEKKTEKKNTTTDDSIDDLTKNMAQLSINMASMARDVHAVKKKCSTLLKMR